MSDRRLANRLKRTYAGPHPVRRAKVLKPAQQVADEISDRQDADRTAEYHRREYDRNR